MRLFIPTIGTKMTLLDDWHFNLYYEYRNQDVVNALVQEEYEEAIQVHRMEMEKYYDARRNRIPYPYPNLENKSSAIVLPKDTVLIVDRIYIRKGAEDFDSITFRIDDGPDRRLMTKKKGGISNRQCRFWAKLPEVNHMNVEILS